MPTKSYRNCIENTKIIDILLIIDLSAST